MHLTDWPDAAEFPADDALVDAMDRVREIASTGLALRKATGLRVRLPLATLTVVVPDPAAVEAFADILRDELNVKPVVLEALAEESLGAVRHHAQAHRQRPRRRPAHRQGGAAGHPRGEEGRLDRDRRPA